MLDYRDVVVRSFPVCAAIQGTLVGYHCTRGEIVYPFSFCYVIEFRWSSHFQTSEVDGQSAFKLL